jgi:hypothetical protein
VLSLSCRSDAAGEQMPIDDVLLSEEVDIGLDQLRELLVLARRRGFQSLSDWAELAVHWAEEANAELARLRPKPGQAYIDGDKLVSAAGRFYCLKHPAYELHDNRRCIRCEELEVWLKSPILYE